MEHTISATAVGKTFMKHHSHVGGSAAIDMAGPGRFRKAMRGLLIAPAIPVAWAIAGAVCFGEEPRSSQGSGEFIVATWAIDWFGDGHEDVRLAGNRNGGRHLRSEDDFRRLREVATRLARSGVDVVAIQEAENETAIRHVFSRAEWDVYPSGREPAPEWAQLTAILVRRDAGFAVGRHPDVVAFSPSGHDRHGVDLTLYRGGRSIRVLNLHFKSGCPGQRLTASDPDCRVLREQFAALDGWLRSRAAEGVPVVVAGNWNRWLSQPGDEAAATLPSESVIAPAVGQRPACWGGRYPWAVDHIVAFAPPGMDAYVSNFREHLYDAPDYLRNRLSNHCAMSAAVRFEN